MYTQHAAAVRPSLATQVPQNEKLQMEVGGLPPPALFFCTFYDMKFTGRVLVQPTKHK